MLISLPGKPDGYFDDLGEIHDYLASLLPGSKGILALYAIALNGPQVVIHMEPVVPLTPSVLREYQKDFKLFCKRAAQNGMREVAAVNARNPNDETWHKFIQKMGFPAPIVMATTVLPIEVEACEPEGPGADSREDGEVGGEGHGS